MASIFINDIKLTLPEKTTILQACDEIGIDVPRFCFHERLLVAGNCRMCLVEVEKTPKPVPSCTMTIADVKGKRIYTKTPLVKKAQESVLEFLLINHPLDCPICDQGGECDLQDQSVYFGSDSSRFYFKKRGVEDKNLGPIIKTVMTRCIHCTRCIRFATEVAGLKDLGTTGRGKKTEIGTYVSKIIKTNLSGNIVDLCPVGALTSKPYAFKARSWELKSTNSIDILDSLCSNIVVQKKGNDVVRILPRINDQLNEEWLTDKARYSFDSLNLNRLNVPLEKNEYLDKEERILECWDELGWEEAFHSLMRLMFFAFAGVRFRVGPLADLETIMACENIGKSLNLKSRIEGYKRSSQAENHDFFKGKVVGNEKVNMDNPLNYRATDLNKKLEDADLILLVNLDLKNEIPLFNVRLANSVKKSGIPIGLVGSNIDSTFNYEHIGFDFKDFIHLVEGNNKFLNKIINAKSPLILFGENCSDWNLNSFYSLLRKINKNINFSVLNHNVAAAGLGEFGYTIHSTDNSHESLFIDIGHISSPEEIKERTGFWVYIGSHGHENLEHYQLILPCTTYLEKESNYMNLTGLIQKSGSLSSSALPQIRKESDILNMFLEFLYRNKHPKSKILKNIDGKVLRTYELKDPTGQSESQNKILKSKNAMHDIHGIDFCTKTAWQMNFKKNSTDIDKYFISNNFSQSSKIMNTVEQLNSKSSYFSKV